MAQPCLSGRNEHIYPTQYRAIAVKIMRFVRNGAEHGITVGLDCGFVRCMFSGADLELLEATGADIGWRCNPILDVDLAGDVLPCYPLASLVRIPLTPEVDAASLRRVFQERTRPYRQAGVFRECSTCAFKSGGNGRNSLDNCPGGCLATTIRRFRRTPFSLVMPRGGDASSTSGSRVVAGQSGALGVGP
jgi:hypothetical protein